MLQIYPTRQKLISSLLLLILLLFSQALTAQQRTTLAQYIDTWSPVAMEEMRRHGIPASIKLAQGILESDYGNSRLAVKGNNHFGIKCHGWQGATYNKDDDARNECFRAYKNAAESYSDHSAFLTSRPRYAGLFELDITDYKGWAHGLKQAGYATNPQYPQLLIGIIERNNLHRFDGMAREMVAEVTTPMPRSQQRTTTTTQAGGEIFPVPLEGPRQQMSNNRIRYLRARPGDTPKSLAQELRMREWQIRNYNDLGDSRPIQPGQIIYLQPKRRRGAFDHHLVQQGETMYDISQKYGIRLQQLYIRNNMEEPQQPHLGQKLLLKGKTK